ncbi:shikimate kinase [Clostridium sp.]|uniref:shikimate kinase n=1 Tax=Clostridium sp. TaxID=1506 RepID=UPI003F3B4FA1
MSKEIVLLIGMPGCGKTIMGKLLAKELNYNFYDMDKYIEEISGKSIDELFKQGEDNFRDWETKACTELSKKKKAVISSGGGVVKKEKNIDLFRENSIIVFIDRPLENIISDINTNTRPLLADGKERLYNLYNERYDLYNKYNDVRILNVGFLKDVIISIKDNVKDKIKK